MKLPFLILTAILATSCADYEYRQSIVFKWKQLAFGFPSPEARHEAEISGNLIPTNAAPIDVQPYFDNKGILHAFVTIPKILDGVPYSLAKVSNEMTPDGPLLMPYPNYEIHQNHNVSNCDAIISAMRTQVTACNQLWIIDSGVGNIKRICAPQLWLIDLSTNEIIHRYKFDESSYKKDLSTFASMIVNVRENVDNCRDTMVYIGDAKGLIVYSYQQNKAWRVENKFVSPLMVSDKKYLHFHPPGQKSEFLVPLHVIDNSTLFEYNKGNINGFFINGGVYPPCTAWYIETIDDTMHCAISEPIAVVTWSTSRPFDEDNHNLININSEEIEGVTSMKIDNVPQINDFWMLSNKLQAFYRRTMDFIQYNFRIINFSYRFVEL